MKWLYSAFVQKLNVCLSFLGQLDDNTSGAALGSLASYLVSAIIVLFQVVIYCICNAFSLLFFEDTMVNSFLISVFISCGLTLINSDIKLEKAAKMILFVGLLLLIILFCTYTFCSAAQYNLARNIIFTVIIATLIIAILFLYNINTIKNDDGQPNSNNKGGKK